MGADPIADSALARPAPALRPYVRRYVGYRYAGFPVGTHLGLPSRSLTVILTLGKPLTLSRVPDPQLPGVELQTAVGGLHARPAVIAHDGDQYGLQLDLTPAGCRALLGLPAAELFARVEDLAELAGTDIGHLREQLAEARTWAARFRLLDRALLRRLREETIDPAVGHAWQLLTTGAATVSQVATEVGYSRRHLAERFRREFGLTPKQATRVSRFERAVRMLRRDPRSNLASVAAACSYYDSAHMTREWSELAGCAPSVWLASEVLPSVQDDSSRERAA